MGSGSDMVVRNLTVHPDHLVGNVLVEKAYGLVGILGCLAFGYTGDHVKG